jgi:pyruvate-ferredoxin/flavodoxin oxidoreductase
MTFADFAVTEARFRKHFRIAPPDTWNESMVALDEFLELEADEREEKFPYLWSVDKKQRLVRLLVDRTMVESCEERRDFWILLRAMAGAEQPETSREEIAAEVRREVVGRIASGLLGLVGGAPGAAVALPSLGDLAAAPAALPAPAAAPPAAAAPAAAGDYLAPSIDTALCTSCDECVRINPKIFKYNADKQATIADPNGGPYSDLVKAAERCTAGVIHPGLPRDKSAKDVAKWIARAAKFN